MPTYMVNLARNLGIQLAQFRVAGALEILFGLLVLSGIWIDWMGSMGSLLMTATAAVAIVAHARQRHPAKLHPAARLARAAFTLSPVLG